MRGRNEEKGGTMIYILLGLILVAGSIYWLARKRREVEYWGFYTARGGWWENLWWKVFFGRSNRRRQRQVEKIKRKLMR